MEALWEGAISYERGTPVMLLCDLVWARGSAGGAGAGDVALSLSLSLTHTNTHSFSLSHTHPLSLTHTEEATAVALMANGWKLFVAEVSVGLATDTTVYSS